jgi:hypothetical protein
MFGKMEEKGGAPEDVPLVCNKGTAKYKECSPTPTPLSFILGSVRQIYKILGLSDRFYPILRHIPLLSPRTAPQTWMVGFTPESFLVIVYISLVINR